MKKGQLNVVYSPAIIMTIVGGIIGYLLADLINIDKSLGIIIGGVIGLLLSKGAIWKIF